MGSGELELYRRCKPVVHTEYTAGPLESPVVTIAEAVAEAADVQIEDLPPLNDYVDTDAIDQLFEPSNKAADSLTLSLKIDQWNVFVRSDGQILVCDATNRGEAQPVFDDQTRCE